MHDTLKIQDSRVQMIAHRGLSGLEKENTASAFVAAGNRSYFGIETDVHRTADGQFIIIHDDDTLRVAGDNLPVEQCTFETLRKVRLKDTDNQRGRNDLVLPSLEEYSLICKKYNKISVLELKNHMESEDIDKIIEILRKTEWLDHTIFISFDLENMIAIREKLPDQPAQFLISKFPDWLMDTLIQYHLDLDIYFRSLTEEHVKQLHANGIKVNVWTVDQLEDAKHMCDIGVDYITSNIIE